MGILIAMYIAAGIAHELSFVIPADCYQIIYSYWYVVCLCNVQFREIFMIYIGNVCDTIYVYRIIVVSITIFETVPSNLRHRERAFVFSIHNSYNLVLLSGETIANVL